MAQHRLTLYQNLPYGLDRKCRLQRNFVLKIVSNFLQLCAFVLCMYPIGMRSCAYQIRCALLQHKCACWLFCALLSSSSVMTWPDVCLTKCILYSKTACQEGTVYTKDHLKAFVTCHGVTLNGSAQKRPLVDACLH